VFWQWTPSQPEQNPDALDRLSSLLGDPSLGVRLKLSDRYQPLADALITGQELDDETFEYTVALDWVRPASQWHAEYSAVEFDNRASREVLGNTLLFAAPSDSRNRFATLQFSYQPTRSVTLAPLVQWSRFKEAETSTEQQVVNYGLQSTIHWLAERVTTDVNDAHNTQKSTAGLDTVFTQRYGTSQFDVLTRWRALLPKERMPGIDLSLRANWNVNRSSLQRNNARYQVMLGIQIHWQAGR